MGANHIPDKWKSKINIGLIPCLVVAFFLSYSFLVHFMDWYMKPVFAKLVLLFLFTGILGLLFFFIHDKFIKQFRFPLKLKQYGIISSFLILFILTFYFTFFYEAAPFFTQHTLEITNISELTSENNWKPVEITGISYQDGSQVNYADLQFHGEHWISDNSILLKPSSAIQFEKSFKGTVIIYFRSNADQGKVLIRWDKQEQTIDLSAGKGGETVVSLSSNSWGSPTFTWRCLAVLSALSDFISLFFLALLFVVFLLTNLLSEKDENEKDNNSPKFNKVDILIIVILLGLSLILSKNLFGDHFTEYARLTGDAANYASFAAAEKYPELFTNDPLLGNIENTDMFLTYHVYLTKLLEPLLGNFGSAFMVLQLPLTFLQLFGFYLLGKELYRNRLFGFLLSAFSFIFVRMNLSEFWGYTTSPIPRFSFQACIPFVLLFILKYGKRIQKWPWILLLTGLLTYVHAVSAPAWSIAIVLSLWFLPPRSESAGKKRKYILVSLLLFILILLPFAMQYLRSASNTGVNEIDFSEVRSIFEYRLPDGQIDFNVAIRDFLAIMTTDIPHKFLMLFSAISLLVMNFVTRKSEVGKRVFAASLWAVGIFIGSVIFTMFDYGIANALGRSPIQDQFIRSLRNFIPISYIFFLWPFAILYQKIKVVSIYQKIIKIMPVLICAVFLFVWGMTNEFKDIPVISSTVNCWKEGKIVCPANEELGERAEFYTKIKELTPENSSIFGEDLAIRYFSLRPMAFSKKDGGIFTLTNHAALLEWYDLSLQYDEIMKLKDNWNQYIDAYTGFSRLVKADYLVVESGYSSQQYYPAGLNLVFSNEGFSLFKIQ